VYGIRSLKKKVEWQEKVKGGAGGGELLVSRREATPAVH
jgi:hypothetical protein